MLQVSELNSLLDDHAALFFKFLFSREPRFTERVWASTPRDCDELLTLVRVLLPASGLVNAKLGEHLYDEYIFRTATAEGKN